MVPLVVTQGAGQGLVQPRPGVVAILRGQQRLVAQQRLARRDRDLRHRVLVGQDHHGADGRDVRGDRGDQGGEAGVHAQHHAAGVVQDVGDVVGGQAGVHGVDDRAHAGYGVVQLEVAVAVPRQGRHPVGGADAEGLQGADELPGALLDAGVGGAVGGALGGAGHHLGRGVMPGGMGEDGGDQQRLQLHQSKHGGS